MSPTPWQVSNEPDDSAGFGWGARRICIRDARGRLVAVCALEKDAANIVISVNAANPSS